MTQNFSFTLDTAPVENCQMRRKNRLQLATPQTVLISILYDAGNFSLCKAHDAERSGTYYAYVSIGFAASNTAERKINKSLFDDLGNNTGTYSSAAFTNRKPKTLFNRDWGNQFNVHINVVARHAHLCAFRKLQIAGYVSCSEIELRSVSIEERSMSAAFFLLQYVYLSFELGMRMNGARLAQYLSSFDFVSLYAS